MLLSRIVILSVLLVSWLETALSDSSLGLVSRRNRARKQAAVAYRSGRYAEALALYRYVEETTPTPTLAERINVAQSLFQLRQYKAAQRELQQPGADPTPELTATAATQLGVLACLAKDTTSALTHFQKALLSNPNNMAARQNYELVKMRFSGKKPAKKPAQQTPKPTEAPQPTQGQRVEQTEQQRDQLNRFRNAAMSEQQAKQLLDALQADDLPYELARRKARRTKPQATAGRW
ncbi:tetratricopeptide repeat protein [Fibrella aestuarina BUZ 2]|uniref:Tetratricopeptide repeat protein n=1 Tax=Fibrella aestuarina BUZ 2 TaxID=1166018 RepID=I0KB71_9BACT|nr:tetratricopeptide repeat protein [Fibrella aestuarina]CCH01374.1 tetratricopeptide repeat protein [Fibrella aestuarina BUZ 2]